MLARVLTFSLLGVDGVPVTVEADIHSGPARVHDRGPARRRRAGVARARARGAAQLRLRVPAAAHHGEPRARRPQQGGPRLRPRACGGGAGGVGPGAAASGSPSCALCGELGLDGSVRGVRGVDRDGPGGARGGLRRAGRAARERGRGGAGRRARGGRRSRRCSSSCGSWRASAPAASRGGCRARCWRCRPTGRRTSASCAATTRVRRALEVAAAGGHNVFMVGPPGSGKSMAARRLPSILPPLTLDEALAVTRVHSVAGVLGSDPIARTRPFRAPHHSISAGGPGRRRHAARAGRGEPRAARRPVPRRARGVLAPRARGAAPAAGGGLGPHHARAAHASRSRRASCSWARATRARADTTATRAATAPARRAGAGPLPGEAERCAARPHRHRAAGRAAVARRAARRGRAGGVGADPRSG